MELEDYRREIDEINREIVEKVSKRVEVVEKIESLKEEKNLDLRDREREEEVKQQFEDLFSEQNFGMEKGREMAEMLIEIAVERQK